MPKLGLRINSSSIEQDVGTYFGTYRVLRVNRCGLLETISDNRVLGYTFYRIS